MAELKKINDTTFSADDLGDVKPKVTIGGKDEKKFIPNLNASFFDDEFYFNLNRKEKPGVLTAIEAKIVGDDTDEFYIDDNGRLKWDIVFDSCPENLTLEWELKYKSGIEFIYQGELTEQEIKDGCVRPDEVVGSYAVYCNKANNKYKTGKLTHIYRPFVIDADGAREWATLLIEKGKLTITLPEKFMSSAKYPVRLDPTLGYTSAGASEFSAQSGYVFITNYNVAAGSSGTASKVYCYTRYTTGGAVLDLGYYDAIDDLPASLQDSDSITPSDGPAWQSSDVSGAITSGNDYCAAARSTYASIYYDSGSSGDIRYITGQTGLPATISSATSHTFRMSLYVEYTESGGGSSLPAILNHHMRH